jgi:tetratricopeptide (TPR) repeat protein
MGLHDQAMENYRLALRFNDRDYKAYFNIGLLLDLRGDYQAAADHFQMAVDINPGFVKAREHLERARAAGGNRDADPQGED